MSCPLHVSPSHMPPDSLCSTRPKHENATMQTYALLGTASPPILPPTSSHPVTPPLIVMTNVSVSDDEWPNGWHLIGRHTRPATACHPGCVFFLVFLSLLLTQFFILFLSPTTPTSNPLLYRECTDVADTCGVPHSERLPLPVSAPHPLAFPTNSRSMLLIGVSFSSGLSNGLTHKYEHARKLHASVAMT
jgi:hypothetical protein